MKYILIIAALILIKLYMIGSAPVAQVQTAQVEPQVEQVAWTTALAERLGNSIPSPDMLKFLDAWVRAEGTAAAFNPLATTKPMSGSSDFNSVHVQDYTSVEQGLDATVLTLQENYPGYSDIVAGIQTNDVLRAFQGLEASPWGTQAALVAQIYNGQVSEQEAPPVAQGAVSSNPIAVDDSAFGINVRAALTANNNALQHVIIQPGETWSFNATVGNPALLDLATIVHPGDGWCNLAARYAQVTRSLGLTPQFEDHQAGDLGGGAENSVAIWNINGEPGSDGAKQDLEITNTLNRPIHFQVQQAGDSVVIVGWID